MEFTFNELPQAVSQLYHKLENIERLLLAKGNPEQPQTDQLLNIKQAAELLILTVPTLYGLVHKRAIPVCKRGKRLYFSKTELMEWVKAGRNTTQDEIESQAQNYINRKRR